jgi:hypothetical protein
MTVDGWRLCRAEADLMRCTGSTPSFPLPLANPASPATSNCTSVAVQFMNARVKPQVQRTVDSGSSSSARLPIVYTPQCHSPYIQSSSRVTQKQISSPPMHPRAAGLPKPCMHNRRPVSASHVSTARATAISQIRSQTAHEPLRNFFCCSGDALRRRPSLVRPR